MEEEGLVSSSAAATMRHRQPQSARVPSLVTWARVSLVTRHVGPCLPCDMFPRGFPHIPNVAVDT